MLKNKNDEINFENSITSELYKIKLNGDAVLFKEVLCLPEKEFRQMETILC